MLWCTTNTAWSQVTVSVRQEEKEKEEDEVKKKRKEEEEEQLRCATILTHTHTHTPTGECGSYRNHQVKCSLKKQKGMVHRTVKILGKTEMCVPKAALRWNAPLEKPCDKHFSLVVTLSENVRFSFCCKTDQSFLFLDSWGCKQGPGGGWKEGLRGWVGGWVGGLCLEAKALPFKSKHWTHSALNLTCASWRCKRHSN